jgi:hypothetical protein
MNYKESVRKLYWLIWGDIKEFSQTDEANHEKNNSEYLISGVGIWNQDLLYEK